jgi:dipeptidase D
MNRVLTGMKPERVFYYFEELCRIPHGSGNTGAISDYCVAFAREQGLNYLQDEVGNVIIYKPATAGYEDAPVVMLQGHLDMVAEKTVESTHDFLKDPLDLFVEDGWIGARGTTLGGDDGIAVAYNLAILEASDLPHPALECVFTVEEETGMDGAKALDPAAIHAKYLINLDSENEGTVLTSCAGGMRKTCEIPVERKELEGLVYQLEITGLKGGHSGAEIHKERGNANILMGRLLYEISRELPLALVSLSGGRKENVIPSTCQAEILTDPQSGEELENMVARVLADWKQEYDVQDPDVDVIVTRKAVETVSAVTPVGTTRVLFFLVNCPNGVQSMSQHIPGLVESSLNLGVMELTEEAFLGHFSIRSSVRSRKYALSHRLEFLSELLGGEAKTHNEYPEWAYEPESHLRDVLCQVYKEQTGKEMQVEAIHAGLECGLFADRMPGMDMISIGPDMRDIHSPNERLSISSVERTWNLVCEVLKRLK